MCKIKQNMYVVVIYWLKKGPILFINKNIHINFCKAFDDFFYILYFYKYWFFFILNSSNSLDITKIFYLLFTLKSL